MVQTAPLVSPPGFAVARLDMAREPRHPVRDRGARELRAHDRRRHDLPEDQRRGLGAPGHAIDRGGALANGVTNIMGGMFGGLRRQHLYKQRRPRRGDRGDQPAGRLRIGGIFIALAFMPKASAVFLIMPAPVIGAATLFTSAIIFINGLQIITSRLLDARRTFVSGLRSWRRCRSSSTRRSSAPCRRRPLCSSAARSCSARSRRSCSISCSGSACAGPGGSSSTRCTWIRPPSRRSWRPTARPGARAATSSTARASISRNRSRRSSTAARHRPARNRGELRRVQPGTAGVVRRSAAGAARGAALERGDHGVRGRRAPARRVHAAPARRSRAGGAQGRPLHDPVSFRPLNHRRPPETCTSGSLGSLNSTVNLMLPWPYCGKPAALRSPGSGSTPCRRAGTAPANSGNRA